MTDSSGTKTRRMHVYYSGMVHGVGFRYAAMRAASSLGLTGWVKNLDDGRVEIVCEGPEEAAAGLLRKMGDLFAGYVRGQEVEWAESTGEFTAFDIELS